MKGIRTILILVSLFLTCGYWHIWADQKAEEVAVAVAQDWLALVDQGAYAKSWRHAAALFKKAVTQEQWEHSMTAFREPLGKVVSRGLKSSTYATSLPGAPDGEYVVIRYSTSFKNKKSAVETVTPMLDPDGQWRVSGYYIK
jgi:hypothetical protein